MDNHSPNGSQKKSIWKEIIRKPGPDEAYWTRNTQLTLFVGVPIMIIVLIVVLVIAFS